MKKIYRIGDKTAISLQSYPVLGDHYKYVGEDGGIQYTQKNQSLDSIVWYDSKRLNKVFNSNQIINESQLISEIGKKSFVGSILLSQGFSWTKVFGVLLIIKSIKNPKITYLSKMYKINDFVINSEKSLINGNIWSVEAPILLNVESTDDLFVDIIVVDNSDIEFEGPTIGFVYSYPTSNKNFEVLNETYILPQSINTIISVKKNLFIELETKSLDQNVTVEEAIKDYLGLENNIVDISVNYLISYGIDETNQNLIKVSNESYNFGKLSIGLDFSDFVSGLERPAITVTVQTEINCNNIKLYRNNVNVIQTSQILDPLITEQIKNPDTVFPVIVKKENIIQNTHIETRTEEKIITINQPVYVDMITDDLLVIENINKSFPEVNKKAYLVVSATGSVAEQIIMSKESVDSKIWFDLSELRKVDSGTNFYISDAQSNNILRKGKIS